MQKKKQIEAKPKKTTNLFIIPTILYIYIYIKKRIKFNKKYLKKLKENCAICLLILYY